MGAVPAARFLRHLLFISGFGLVCLIAASRVIIGRSGSVELFACLSSIARAIVIATVLAAATQATADFMPQVMITHYQYAAWSRVAASGLWFVWHSCRFFKKDEE